ncbi:MAG: tetratricopeptide repeat protein [Bacteroidetes bacterium]|nr:tetratricopeptide repeat protein [Bacteroidota bacterium]
MKNRFKYSPTIERYLSNEMEYAEMRSFEKEILTNSTLSSELSFTRSIDDALRNDDIIDFRLKLASARNENVHSNSSIPVIDFKQKKFWYMAASLLLIAALGTVLYFNINHGYTSDDLFAKYYTPENMINVTRSGDANIVEAIIRFQDKDYQTSANLFSQILARDPENYAGWFFYGIACIESQKFAKAEAAFNTIISNNENLYVEHAQWYLALCFIKSNQVAKAKLQLQKIASEPDNFHRKDAKHLLEKLAN